MGLRENGSRIKLAGAALAFLAMLPTGGLAASEAGANAQSSSAQGTPQAPAKNGSQSDDRRLSVNPVTGQTTASSADFQPLTGSERWKLYFRQSYLSVGAYVGPLLAALALDQSRGDPKQWGGGFPGYGRRLASRIAAGDIVQNSFQFSAAALLHEDVRYISSGQHGFKARAGHAILYSFLTYNNQGRPTLNLANLGGYFVASGVSTLWLPGQHRLATYTLTDGSEALGLSVPVNLFQEFWPEISRTLHRRK